MVYNGTEPQNTTNIEKLPFKIIRIDLCRKLLKNTLKIRKRTRSWKVAKLAILQGPSIVRQSDQKKVHFESEL